jgi:atypical dual specificity phosphatase
MPPPGFSWVDRPKLAALARPDSGEDLQWLRRNGIDVLVSLTEHPLPRNWVNDAGILAVSVPVPDMESPSDRQLDHILATIRKANESGMGVAVHCAAGLGRTGTVLAAYFVGAGLSARDALVKVRDLRPGSVETAEQERAIERLARRLADSAGEPPNAAP